MGGGADWVKMKEITEVLSQWSDTQKVRASSFHTSPIRTGVIDTPRGIECDWNRTESGSDLLLLWFKWGHGQHWLAWFFLVARSSVQWLPTTPTEPLLAQGVNGRYLLSLRWLSDLFIFFQLIKDSEHIANNLPPSAVCFSPVLLGFANHFHQVLCCHKYGIVPPTEAKHVLTVVSQLMHIQRPAHVAFPVLSHGHVICERCSCDCHSNDTTEAQFSGFSMVFQSTL